MTHRSMKWFVAVSALLGAMTVALWLWGTLGGIVRWSGSTRSARNVIRVQDNAAQAWQTTGAPSAERDGRTIFSNCTAYRDWGFAGFIESSDNIAAASASSFGRPIAPVVAKRRVLWVSLWPPFVLSLILPTWAILRSRPRAGRFLLVTSLPLSMITAVFWVRSYGPSDLLDFGPFFGADDVRIASWRGACIFSWWFSTFHTYEWRVNYLAIFCIAAIAPACAAAGALAPFFTRMTTAISGKEQTWRSLTRGLCPRCRYNVTATTDRCPECGTPIAMLDLSSLI